MAKISTVAAVLTIVGVTAASAAVVVATKSANITTAPKSLVIIDTGYDATQTQFTNHIVGELCVSTLFPSCPNKKNNQEGAGAAALPASIINQSNVNTVHGTQMIAAAETVNGNTPIVFVRASSILGSTVFLPSNQDVVNVLNWVYANRNTYNIGTVSSSIASSITSCSDASLLTALNNLKSVNIPFINSAGNEGIRTKVDYPGCVKPAISVGSTDNNVVFSDFSNSGAGLDFAALGKITVNIWGKNTQVVGTSVSAPVFAASWTAIENAKPTLNYSQIYSLIQSTQILTSNTYVHNIPTINLAGALK